MSDIQQILSREKSKVVSSISRRLSFVQEGERYIYICIHKHIFAYAVKYRKQMEIINLSMYQVGGITPQTKGQHQLASKHRILTIHIEWDIF